MDLVRKIKRLNTYYHEYGLTETISAINYVGSRAILKKYPFRYRYPARIAIEIMDICNLKCRHCYLQSQSFTDGRGFMDYDMFERIVSRISPFLKTRQLSIMSVEALFHNRIFDMYDLITKYNKHSSQSLITNGMLLDETRINNLLNREIYSVCISLDGCKKETVESFKTGVDFDRVVSNMRKLREKGGNKVKISTIFVAHKGNIDELMDYIDFCSSLGVTHIQVTGFISFPPEMTDYCLYSEMGIKEIDEMYRRAKQKAETIGIGFSHPPTKLEPKGCDGAPEIMYIDKKGNISPCAQLARKTRMSLFDKVGTSEPIIWGNVLEEDPYKIWKSKASVDFRRQLHERKLPEECALCAMGYGVIHL